jgi:hypothetical protein
MTASLSLTFANSGQYNKPCESRKARKTEPADWGYNWDTPSLEGHEPIDAVLRVAGWMQG